MKKHYLTYFILIALFLSPMGLFVGNVNASWWNTDYEFYKTITIDHDYIDNSLTNFPILVVIDDTTADKCNGGDSIRFIDSDETTEYYYEIEKWVDNEDRIVWVNVTSISSTVDDVLKMYYGNDGASDNQNPTNVWDSNFKAVYHMKDINLNTIGDSTINSNDGTKKANYEPIESTGKMGKGQDFDGTNDYIDCGNGVSIQITGALTIETWANTDASTGWNRLISKDDVTNRNFYLHSYQGCPFFGIFISDAEKKTDRTQSTDIDGAGWYYLVGKNDETDLTYYENGVLVDTATGYGGTIDNDGVNLWLGARQTDEYYNGDLDEIRISNIARSNAWIKASYHSQLPTEGFITFGSEQTQNTPPVISNENPTHESIDIVLQPIVNVTITDSDGDNCICNFYTSFDNISWTWRQTNSSILNESIEYNYINASNYSTLYYWKITANDTYTNVSSIFNFTTKANTPPNFSVPSPANNSIEQNLAFTWSIFIGDPDIDTFNWSINCSNAQTNSGNVDSNGTKTLSLTGLSYITNYTIWVNATDSYDWTRKWFNFTTKSEPTYPPVISNENPLNNSEDITLFPVLSITISDLDGDNMSIAWLSNATGTWENIGYILSNVNNGTYYQKFTEFAIYDLTYYWNVSVTDGTYTTVSNTFSFTSESIPTTGNGDGEIGLLGIFGFLGFLAYRRFRQNSRENK